MFCDSFKELKILNKLKFEKKSSHNSSENNSKTLQKPSSVLVRKKHKVQMEKVSIKLLTKRFLMFWGLNLFYLEKYFAIDFRYLLKQSSNDVKMKISSQ